MSVSGGGWVALHTLPYDATNPAAAVRLTNGTSCVLSVSPAHVALIRLPEGETFVAAVIQLAGELFTHQPVEGRTDRVPTDPDLKPATARDSVSPASSMTSAQPFGLDRPRTTTSGGRQTLMVRGSVDAMTSRVTELHIRNRQRHRITQY